MPTIKFHKDLGIYYPGYATDPHKEWAYVQKRVSDASLVTRFLAPHERLVVVQAGGHVGAWPSLLAQMFCKVITFEAEPTLHQCLEMNTHGFGGRIVSFNAALGYEHGAERKMLVKGSPGTNRIDPNGDLTVKETTIDHVLEGRGCDAIILDVEGYEVEALRGAVSTILNYRPVIQVEMLPRSSGAIDSWLKKMRYRQRCRVHNDAIYTC